MWNINDLINIFICNAIIDKWEGALPNNPTLPPNSSIKQQFIKYLHYICNKNWWLFALWLSTWKSSEKSGKILFDCFFIYLFDRIDMKSRILIIICLVLEPKKYF